MKLKTVLIASALAAATSSVVSQAQAYTVTLPDPGDGNYNFSPAPTYDGVSFFANAPTISGAGTSIGADQVNFFDDAFGGFVDLQFSAANSFNAVLSQGYAGSSGLVSIIAYDGGEIVYSSTSLVGGEDSFTPFSLSGIGPITEVNVSTFDQSQFPGIAQVEIGSMTSAVPETSTWAMMLIGFGGLGFLAYRKTRDGASNALSFL